MSKAISSNKRENEKKKQAKRLEKQKKKENRKTEGATSFEDMIAYVDENGMITSTPPDMNIKKEELDIDSINISTPKKEKVEEDPIQKGRVEHFNQSKGYGFIKSLTGVDKYFFHISNCPENIAEGNIVSFELERGARGMNAVNINLVEQ